jgi:hypothetical protein
LEESPTPPLDECPTEFTRTSAEKRQREEATEGNGSNKEEVHVAKRHCSDSESEEGGKYQEGDGDKAKEEEEESAEECKIGVDDVTSAVDVIMVSWPNPPLGLSLSHQRLALQAASAAARAVVASFMLENEMEQECIG